MYFIFYSLLHNITLAALAWLWTRREIQKSVVPVLLIVGLVCSYKGLILDKQIQDETFLGANETDNMNNGDNTLLNFTTGPKQKQGCQSNVLQGTVKFGWWNVDKSTS